MIRFHDALLPLLVPIEDVRQHPDNANNGDTDAIIESIEVNGYLAPVVVQRSTGYILAGNHRYAACLELGSQTIPVIWADMDDESALRYLLADNRTAQRARMDNALLVELLQKMQDTDKGLVGTGYDEPDIAYLLSRIEEDGAGHGFAPRHADPVVTEMVVCPNCEHMFPRRIG